MILLFIHPLFKISQRVGGRTPEDGIAAYNFGRKRY
jgi:hypothetical protein